MTTITTQNKETLQAQGWTLEKVRQRLADCRAYQRQYRAEGAGKTYRIINANFYCQHKARLAVLSK